MQRYVDFAFFVGELSRIIYKHRSVDISQVASMCSLNLSAPGTPTWEASQEEEGVVYEPCSVYYSYVGVPPPPPCVVDTQLTGVFCLHIPSLVSSLLLHPKLAIAH